MKKILLSILLAYSFSIINAAAKSEENHFLQIPTEVQATIGSCLTYKDIANTAATCKDLNKGMWYLTKTWNKQNIKKNDTTEETKLALQALFSEKPKIAFPQTETKSREDIMKACAINNPEKLTNQDIEKLLDYAAKHNHEDNNNALLLIQISNILDTKPNKNLRKKLESLTTFHTILSIIIPYIKEKIDSELQPSKLHWEKPKNEFTRLIEALCNNCGQTNMPYKLLFIAYICLKNNFFNVSAEKKDAITTSLAIPLGLLGNLNADNWMSISVTDCLLSNANIERFIPLIHCILKNEAFECNEYVLGKNIASAIQFPYEILKIFIDEAEKMNVSEDLYDTALKFASIYGCESKKIKLFVHKASKKAIQGNINYIQKVENKIKVLKNAPKRATRRIRRHRNFFDPQGTREHDVLLWQTRKDKRSEIEKRLNTNKRLLKEALKQKEDLL